MGSASGRVHVIVFREPSIPPARGRQGSLRVLRACRAISTPPLHGLGRSGSGDCGLYADAATRQAATQLRSGRAKRGHHESAAIRVFAGSLHWALDLCGFFIACASYPRSAVATQATTPRPSYASEYKPPKPLPAEAPIDLPADGIGYRLKRRLLGQPLHTEQLEDERLGKPTALAVFASDNLSSSAYATEEILRVLVPAVGLAAFSLVVPITVAMLVVLAFLILSYRETIKAYPTAGGAYMVTRDNFGLLPAQVAGVALLTDYVLTVAVSVAAGTAALVSAVSGLTPYTVPISVAFIVLIAYGNLRGVRESGRVFAAPTYFFIASMAVLLSHRPRTARCSAICPPPSTARKDCSTSAAVAVGCSWVLPCSSSSMPLPRAAPRSPVSRRSPTVCRRSASRRGVTPAPPSSSWAPCSASCSSACRSWAATWRWHRSPRALRR